MFAIWDRFKRVRGCVLFVEWDAAQEICDALNLWHGFERFVVETCDA